MNSRLAHRYRLNPSNSRQLFGRGTTTTSGSLIPSVRMESNSTFSALWSRWRRWDRRRSTQAVSALCLVPAISMSWPSVTVSTRILAIDPKVHRVLYLAVHLLQPNDFNGLSWPIPSCISRSKTSLSPPLPLIAGVLLTPCHSVRIPSRETSRVGRNPTLLRFALAFVTAILTPTTLLVLSSTTIRPKVPAAPQTPFASESHPASLRYPTIPMPQPGRKHPAESCPVKSYFGKRG
jgi:hypothetical protein